MTNQEFKEELDRLLKPHGFKKKGNKWTAETEELEKVIYLQKSDYSNRYYLNYGYNFKDLDYKEVSMHIWNRLGSKKRKERKLIFDTLDLTNSMDKTVRNRNTEYFVNDLLLPVINSINTKTDIVKHLESRSHLNNVFLPVKKHLNLENAENTNYNTTYKQYGLRALCKGLCNFMKSAKSF
ncbi:DUF4304 domain-containing protein [Maribacter sp. MJ134]|uniref:DUF4304 domain-containing protein n=1 Tax=Maribacter sp. MJ134 TaxID=2496865 RepID=UPI000F84648A|nr:DUF4304 domain-containing protein [Maribacter sp. MJ134]AZQ59736.1 DUF4304 domain-containing protein [Maribacter sp. MJ134]